MKEKVIWFDIVRVVSTFAVIVLHVSAPILYKYGKVSDEVWHTGNVYDGIVRFCVPVFFMLSGALLLNKDYELKYFLKKRFFRIIPPLIFWSLAYISYDYIIAGEHNFTFISGLEMVLKNLANGSQYHLWFVYTLLGLYLFIPILRKWVKNSNNNEMLYFLIIWFITIVYSVPYFKTYFPNIPLTNFSGFIGYMVLGYYLSKITLKHKLLPISITIIGMVITIFGTHYLTQKENHFIGTFYSYLSPNVLASSIGVFLIFKNMTIKSAGIKKLVLFLSNHSFGIYLCHILILTLLNKFGINWTFTNPVISIPITSLICILLSSLTIYAIRKIKYGKYVSG